MSEPVAASGAGELAEVNRLLIEAELAEQPLAIYRLSLRAVRACAASLLSGSGSVARPEDDRLWPRLVFSRPGMAEWASWFVAAERVLREQAWVSQRQADDLLRDAQAFTDLVRRLLR